MRVITREVISSQKIARSGCVDSQNFHERGVARILFWGYNFFYCIEFNNKPTFFNEKNMVVMPIKCLSFRYSNQINIKPSVCSILKKKKKNYKRNLKKNFT